MDHEPKKEITYPPAVPPADLETFREKNSTPPVRHTEHFADGSAIFYEDGIPIGWTEPG